jgi:hypothetical protein
MSLHTCRNGGPPPVPPPAPTSAWTRPRRAAVELTADAIDHIAERVADLLEQRAEQKRMPSAGLIDVAELARHLGVTRAWVYQHADELGAIRIGSGPRARLRFELGRVEEALTPAPAIPSPANPRRKAPGKQPEYAADPTVTLLPVTPRRVRGAFLRLRSVRRMRDR